MSVNRFQPHLFVLPEDDADRQLALGFQLGMPSRQVRSLPEAGGWRSVVERFASDEVGGMRKYNHRFIVLLIDFDGNPNRLNEVRGTLPADIANRVFVLGPLTKPEHLKPGLGKSFEEIGRAMAYDCRNGTDAIWSHPLLQHNAEELARIRVVCEFLLA